MDGLAAGLPNLTPVTDRDGVKDLVDVLRVLSPLLQPIITTDALSLSMFSLFTRPATTACLTDSVIECENRLAYDGLHLLNTDPALSSDRESAWQGDVGCS